MLAKSGVYYWCICRSLVDDSTLGPSKFDVLSDAVMDRAALNDMESEDDEGECNDYHIQISFWECSTGGAYYRNK